MNQRQAKRVHRELTTSEEERLKQYRQQIAEELPDLQARDQMRKEAQSETTLSGELRRAIHASDLSLAEIAGARCSHAGRLGRLSDRRADLAFRRDRSTGGRIGL